ncbi:DsrE family protein [Halolactibacillus sp. JCM 19043]|uniref:DsrE family protein n=1 Tax=Halolactibacillus sp. JCM 19043 TaxID=1460638 RepID=UPI000784DCA2|nr:DsrE family protein [Halolactibacillus sp. JCM 19043]
MRRVIFHLDESDKWQLALNNVNNMVDYASEEVILLVNGPAISGLVKTSEVSDRLKHVLNKEVKVKACLVSLTNKGISQTDLVEGIDTVPSGVVYLSDQQHHGASYIKP